MNLLCFTCVGFGVWFDWWQLMTQRLSSLYVDTLATANALPGCWCWRYTTRSNWPPARKMSRVLGLGSSSNANLPMAKSNGAIDTPISDTQRYPRFPLCEKSPMLWECLKIWQLRNIGDLLTAIFPEWNERCVVFHWVECNVHTLCYRTLWPKLWIWEYHLVHPSVEPIWAILKHISFPDWYCFW